MCSLTAPLTELPQVFLCRIAAQTSGTGYVPILVVSWNPDCVLVQNEFRIDSSRLQPEDKGMMFRLMYFFMSFHHQLHQAAVKDAAHAGRKGADLPKFELGHVLETMDLMSFNLVLREAETAMSEKNISEQNAKRLAECVAVLKEMMHIVVSEHYSYWRACSPEQHKGFMVIMAVARNMLQCTVVFVRWEILPGNIREKSKWIGLVLAL